MTVIIYNILTCSKVALLFDFKISMSVSAIITLAVKMKQFLSIYPHAQIYIYLHHQRSSLKFCSYWTNSVSIKNFAKRSFCILIKIK